MREHVVVWASSFTLALAQWRHTQIMLGKYLVWNVNAEQGVVEGYPHWRVYQSRLLGPWIERSLGYFGIDFFLAHLLVAVALTTLSGVAIFHAGTAIGGKRAGWAALFALNALFALIVGPPWLYIWDYFIVLFGLVFLWLVVRQAPWWAFLALMGIASLNHESALFIGVWMAATGLIRVIGKARRPDWTMLAAGLVGGLGGIALIEFLRSSLLKMEVGRQIFTDADDVPRHALDAHFHIKIFANLEALARWLTAPDFELMFLIPLVLLVTVGLAWLLVARQGVRAAPLALYAVTQVLALLVAGLLGETRVLLELLPFLCLAPLLAGKGRPT